MSQIQRVCDDVYESFASSAFASASTVERNVRSSVAKLPAFVIASRAWLAIPASSSSSRPATSDSISTASAARPWSIGMNDDGVGRREVARVEGAAERASASSRASTTNGSLALRSTARRSQPARCARPWSVAYAASPSVARHIEPAVRLSAARPSSAATP